MTRLAVNIALQKIFAVRFYQVHAGTFLFLFLILFGAVEPQSFISYQKTLILASVSSIPFLLIVFLLWLLYGLKAMHYCLGELRMPAQAFISYSLTSLSKKEQLENWFLALVIINLPLGVYAIPMIVLALSSGLYLSAAAVVLYFFGLSVGAAWVLMSYSNRFAVGDETWLTKILGRFGKPFWSIGLLEIAERQKIAFLVTKGISYLIITALFWMFYDVKEDLRVAFIAVLAIGAAHTGIVQYQQRFAEEEMAFSRNLPYTLAKRFAFLAMMYACILLPELVWIMARFSIESSLQLSVCLIGISLFFHCFLYLEKVHEDNFYLVVFTFFIAFFVFILFTLGLAVGLALWPIAFLILFNNYYKNENMMIK